MRGRYKSEQTNESILAQKKALSVGKDLSIPAVSLVIYWVFLFCAWKLQEVYFTAALKEELLFSVAKKKKVSYGQKRLFHGDVAISLDSIESATLRILLNMLMRLRDEFLCYGRLMRRREESLLLFKHAVFSTGEASF